MAIVVCGLSHKTVPLDTLERLAFPPTTLPKALQQLMDHEVFHEGVILSTCNRTELYASVHRFHPAVEAARRFLSDVSGVGQDVIADGLYTYHDTGAVKHLFNVAAGTDSMVVGETQILGQVRESYRAADEQGTARRMLGALFQRALRVGKRARSETEISRHVTSLPQAAARVAGELVGGLSGRRVVVIGAGRMAELAARAAQDGGADDLLIVNRSPDRAERLADELGAAHAALADARDRLGHAEVILSATASVGHVLERDDLASREGGELVVIDLAVPRDIDPAARELPGVQLRDIDDLGAVVDRGTESRLAELPKVEAIVDEEVDDFCAWERSLALGPSIKQLTEWAEDLRRREVDRLAREGGEREQLDELTRRLVNKLLHRPVTSMKELVRGKDGQVYLEAFQEIFDVGATDD